MNEDPRWESLVNSLIRVTIKYWPEVVLAYGQIEQTEKLVGRRFNYWAPLLAVCRVFAPDRFADLLSLAEEDSEKCEASDELSEVENALLNVLLQSAAEAEGDSFTLLLKEATQRVQELLPWVKDWHMTKSAIDNLAVVKQKINAKNGATYRFDVERVRAKAVAKGIKAEQPSSKDENPRKPILTKENVQLVCETVRRQCHSKESVDISELVLITGLTNDELAVILEKLQREGAVAQCHPDAWRPV